MPSDYGIGKYQAHISLWAVQEVILEPHKFRRRSRRWIKEMFGLSHDPNRQEANADIVRQAISDGWFIRNPIIPLGIIQCFFLGEHRGVGWQSEKLAIDIPEVLANNGHGDMQLQLWSAYTPRSIISMGFMIVSTVLCAIVTLLRLSFQARHNLLEWETGSWVRSGFTSWDSAHHASYKQYCEKEVTAVDVFCRMLELVYVFFVSTVPSLWTK
jgi:hypothetical protein